MVWKRFYTALNSYSIFMRKGGKSRKSNSWNEKLSMMGSYTCEDFQDEISDVLSHDQKHHFHFGRKKQDVWESFFLEGPIFDQKRPFCLKLTSFWLDLSLTKKSLFSWWEFALAKNGFFICGLFSWRDLSLTKNGFFCLKFTFLLMSLICHRKMSVLFV